MSANPFLSLDRQNFPAFSPMFKKKTPSSTEVKCLKFPSVCMHEKLAEDSKLKKFTIVKLNIEYYDIV